MSTTFTIVVEVEDVERFLADIADIRAIGSDGNIEASGYAYYDHLVSVQRTVVSPWLVGAALGVLKARGRVEVRIGEDWCHLNVHLDEDDEPTLTLDSVLLLVQAEEVKG